MKKMILKKFSLRLKKNIYFYKFILSYGIRYEKIKKIMTIYLKGKIRYIFSMSSSHIA